MAKKQYEWKIIRLRAKAEFVGIVEAPDEEAAISAAIDLFKITDPHQKRLLAQRRS
jgi:hypothetical protein